MRPEDFFIQPYKDIYRQQMLAIWEQAVIDTHGFLSRNDFEAIKELVSSIDFNNLQVFCLMKADTVFGFIGVANKKIEMLFLNPELFGQGLGQKLLRFAINELHANKLDVNEQNTKAVHFYLKSGFEIFERTTTDDQGRNYPLLRMKLKNS